MSEALTIFFLFGFILLSCQANDLNVTSVTCTSNKTVLDVKICEVSAKGISVTMNFVKSLRRGEVIFFAVIIEFELKLH